MSATDVASVRIAVVGAGAWGTALANGWAQAGCRTVLFARDAGRASRRLGDILPGVSLDPALAPRDDPAVLADATHVAFAVPTQSLGEAARAASPALPDRAVVIGCAKGIERASGRLPHAVLGEALPGRTIATLSGPGFAGDVARAKPTAVTLAASDLATARLLAGALSTPSLRLYASDDRIGAEAGGALKNVLALAVGMARGLDLGASAEAALVARGFAEMTRLAMALGGRRETLAGLSGLGDLVLSCAPGSRNFSYGTGLARGEAMTGRPLAEGVFTTRMAVAAARERHVEVPLMEAVDAILEGMLAPAEAVGRLLSRPLRTEG